VAQLRQGSAVDPPLHVLGVALALDVDLVGGRGDLLYIVGGEFDVDRVSVSCRRWVLVVPGIGTIQGC
jgi:hypothetical protein